MPQRATDERSRWPESVFTFPESVFNLPGMRVHLRPESVFKIVRNTQPAPPEPRSSGAASDTALDTLCNLRQDVHDFVGPFAGHVLHR